MSREYPCVYYENEKCKKFTQDGYTSWCVLGPCSHKTPSNADRIRDMSDEELAELLANETYRIAKPCFDAFGYGLEKQVIYAKRLDWLKQPAE